MPRRRRAAAPPAAPMPAGPIAQSLREALVKTYAHQSDDHGPARSRCAQRDEDVAHRPRRRAGRRLRQRPGSTRTCSPRNLRAATAATSPSAATSACRSIRAAGSATAVRAANTRVEAGRADLRATEGDIFTEAVAAYMDVIRDRSIVQLNQNQVRVLDTNLQATRDRFEVGDLTRTDVAQSDARLALARSQPRHSPKAGCEASEENYRRVIGELPGDLQPPPPLPTLARHAPTRRPRSRSATMPISPRSPPRRAPPATTSASRAASGCRPSRRSAATRYFNALGTRRRGAGVADGTCPIRHDQRRHRPVAEHAALPGRRAPARGSARRRRSAASCSSRRSRSSGCVVSNTRAAFAAYRAAQEAIEFEQDRGRRQPARARRHPRRADRRHPQRARRAQRRAGAAEQPGAARHRAPRRLCRRLPAAERDGHGRGGGSQPRRRPALRPAGQLQPLFAAAGPTGTTGRDPAPVSTRTAPPGRSEQPP